MTATSPPPTDERPARTQGPEKPSESTTTKLSITQVVASALAAVSTTVMLSFFGIAGTIIGAGAASVLTVIANFLYTRSIERTHAQLKPVMGQMVRPRPGTRTVATGSTAAGTVVTGPADDGAHETEHVAGTGQSDATPSDATGPSGATGPAPAQDPARNAWLRLVDRHGTVRVLAASAGVLFLVVMGIVLATELVLGKPLSAAVQGVEGSGTSLSRTVDGETASTVGSGNRITGDEETGPASGTDATPPEQGDGAATDDTTDETVTGTEDDATSTPTPDPGPTETVEPTDPAEPTDPTEPTDPGAPTDPVEPTDPATPGDGEAPAGPDGGTSTDVTGDGTDGATS